MRKLILCLSLFFPNLVIAGWFGGPNDYNSCILESMRGVTSDVAARMIRNACKDKFPVKIQEDEELPKSSAQNIEGNAKGLGGYFQGTIYNGDSEWTITGLEIRVTDKKTNQFRDYKALMDEIRPIKKGTFVFETYQLPEDYSWIILRAFGHKN
jgi:hypothetical protein